MGVEVTAQLLIIASLISPYSGYERLTEDIHIYTGADFGEVVTTTLFVDKSLLIKAIVDNTNHGSGLLILAPRHFGKSTNLNMVKRFLEMNVDESGQSVALEETTNYNLFRNNYLNIYILKDFFKKHVGKYPVISIDYQILSVVTSVEQIYAIFLRKIMMDTFFKHKYLLNDSYLWTFNETFRWIKKEKFEMFLNESLNHKLTESDIHTGFTFLSKLLYKRFEKRVIVLIDNYDAFVDSPLFSENKNIFHFISVINYDLLRSESVERSMVTGVVRSSGPSLDRGEILPPNVVASTADHNVWTYYGLSGVELDRLLQPIVKYDEEREKVMGKIVHNYSGYSAATFEVGQEGSGQLLDTQTCSVWSVIKYMEKEMVVDNFSSLV